jgi:hypothetical protein
MVDVEQLRTTQKASDAVKSKVAVTGPALPASTVDGTNTTGKTLLGRISAGTVTVFKVNGVTVGGMTTGEWFFLKPGDTFNITYSVAPTLQFFEF